MKAFAIIEKCVQTSKAKSVINALPMNPDNNLLRARFAIENQNDEQYCSSVLQRDIAGRTALLEQAVLAKIPGAAEAYFAAGPNGQPDDLSTRPDDPTVLAWKANAIKYLTRNAEGGDMSAMERLVSIYSGDFGDEQNLCLSLGYQLALSEIQKTYTGSTSNRLLSRIADTQARMNESDISAARIFEAQLIVSCCKKQ